MAEVSDRDMPLFVRVEGYKDVLKDLEAIRQILENMDESVQVLKKVQQVKEKSIKNFIDNVDRLDDKLDSVNVEMPELNDMDRPGIRAESEKSARRKAPEPEEDDFPEESPDIRSETEIDDGRKDEEDAVKGSINDLHSELKGLKDQLNNL